MTYTKLSRKKRSLMGSVQLWLGDDHILVVRSMRFTEEYRRFLLADIQAVVAAEVPSRLLLQIFFFGLSALCFVGLLEVDSMGARIFFAVLGAMFAGASIYDVVRGQRCRCRLLTEVSSEVLDPVTRVADFERLMLRLQPAIDAVQGEMPADTAMLQIQAGGPVLGRNASVDDPLSSTSKYLPYLLYAVMLCTAACYTLGYLFKRMEGFSLAFSLWMGEIALCAVLAWRPRRFGLEGTMLSLLYITAILLVLDFAGAVTQIANLLWRIAEAGREGSPTPNIWDIEWMMTAGRISIAWRCLFGVLGLLALWLGRDRVARSEEVAPSPPLPPSS